MKISLITTVYNRADTIQDTFDSVLAQTYQDIEYIVVDGGSTDGTLDLIRQVEPRFQGRMRWTSGADKGLYDAMNKGIRMATGDAVGILNSDDFFTSPDVLERVADAFVESGAEAVYGDVHFVPTGNPDKCVRYYSSRVFRPALFRFGFMPAHPAFYVKKSCYDRFGLYSLDYQIAADFDLLVRFLYKEKIKAKYLPLDCVTMRVGGVSTEGLHSRVVLNRESVRACRKYGIRTNLLLILFKYVYKVFELRW